MTTLEKFKASFEGRTIPDVLLKLWQFQEEFGFENYANGFGLNDDVKAGAPTYSTENEFLSSIIDFAQADGTGSIYAFWIVDPEKDLSEQPIVVFGSEGGAHIVAENLPRLLQLITFDAEPMVDWDGVTYYKDDGDYEESSALEDYIAWLKQNLKLDPIDDADSIVDSAREKYRNKFESWIKRFRQTDDE